MPQLYDTIPAYGESRPKGITMKKSVLLSLVAASFAGTAFASDYYQIRTTDCRMESMQRVLDQATAERRAVITVVQCDKSTANENDVVVRTVQSYDAPVVRGDDCAACARPVERVVNRQYFVRETVQQYRPVIKYVPDGAYTRVRAVCGDFDCE